jgi:hypothetical protein
VAAEIGIVGGLATMHHRAGLLCGVGWAGVRWWL